MTVKCNKCKEEINKEDLEKNYYICPLCGKLNRMPAKNRLQMLTEKFDVMFNDQKFTDPIDFPSHKEKYESAREKSGETEGVVCGRATASDYINATITDFVELHGDRCFADDHAIVGGIG